MEKATNQYHKEFYCNSQLVEEEQQNISKRFHRNKLLWSIYGMLLIFSFIFLPIWMTSLLLLAGFILFPASMYGKELRKKPPFIAVDSKYVQFKGRIIRWNSIKNIVITHEQYSNKEISYNYNIIFKYENGRELHIDTYYFPDQEDILNSITLLANHKNIPVERLSSTDLFFNN